MEALFKAFMPELPELDELLHSGALAAGTYTKEFEDILKEFFNASYLLTTNSYESAVNVVTETLGLRHDDIVVASPMACLVSTQPYQARGYKLKWADIDPKIGTLSPDSVKSRIDNKVKLIVHNHFCGYPGYIDEINEIGKKYGIPVIDDGIECFGSEYKGNKIGLCGTDITIFSLSAVRLPNCIDGGVIIFQDESLYNRAILVRDCGIERSRFRDESGEIDPSCDIVYTGFSAKMSNVNAYIGIQQMKNIQKLLNTQRLNAKNWDQKLETSSYQRLNTKDSNPNYWVYGLLAEDKKDAIHQFRREGFYASGVHLRNDNYSVFGKADIELHGVDEFSRRFFAIPCGWWMK